MHAQHAEVRTAKITLVFKIKDLRMLGCRAPLARTAQAELRDESGRGLPLGALNKVLTVIETASRQSALVIVSPAAAPPRHLPANPRSDLAPNPFAILNAQ